MKKLFSILLILSLYISPAQSFAHSGRTDSNGGHYNRKTGGYHYHSGTKSSRSKSRKTVGAGLLIIFAVYMLKNINKK